MAKFQAKDGSTDLFTIDTTKTLIEQKVEIKTDDTGAFVVKKSNDTEIFKIDTVNDTFSFAQGNLTVEDTTDSTSVSTGSGIFHGGIGVAKSGYFGERLHVNYTSGIGGTPQIAVSPVSNGAESSIGFYRNTVETSDLWALGHNVAGSGAGVFSIANSVFGGNTLTISSSGQIRGLATTNSTSFTNGAVVFDGGVGIAKSLYLGLNLSVIDKNDLPATTNLGYPVLAGNYTSPDSGRLFFGDGSGWKWYISSRTASTTTDLITFTDSGTITLNNSLNATSATVGGSLTSAGGAGIAKRLYVGNSTIVSSSNFSDAPTSNLFTVSGITFTDNTTATSGTVGSWYASTLAQPTYASTNTGITVTNSATLRISGAPIQGTNTTITNSYALSIGSGRIISGDSTASTSSTTGALILSGGGMGINNTTDATSAINGGSLTSAGGIAIAKSGYFGGKLNINYSGLNTSPQLGVSPQTNDAESSISFYRNTGGSGENWILGHKTDSASAGTFGIYNSTFAGNVLTISNTGQIRGLATTNSTSSTTGGAIFDGGVGIAKDLYSGGNLGIINNANLPASISFGHPILAGNYSSPFIGRFFIGDNSGWTLAFSSRVSSTTSDIVTFKDNVSDATSPTNGGSITSFGGIGIAKSGYFGRRIHVNYTAGVGGTPQVAVSPVSNDGESSIGFYRNTSETSDLWALGHNTSSVGAGSFGIYNSVFAGNVLTISNSGQIRGLATTNSTSSTTGGAIFDGGMGVAKDLYIGQNLNVSGSITAGVSSPSLTTANNVNITGSVTSSGVFLYSNGNSRMLYSIFRLTPTTSNSTTSFEIVLPNRTTNFSDVFSINITVDGFYNDADPISIENKTGNSVISSTNGRVKFTSSSTGVHTVFIKVVYTSG